MNLSEAMERLESLGNETIRAMNTRNGAGSNQFGVKMGDLRVIAQEVKSDPALATELWQTGNLDAMFLATLLMKPKQISTEELEQMVRSVQFTRLADWLGSHVIKHHPDKELLRKRWMISDNPMCQRSGWSLTSERVSKAPDGLDLSALLNRIEAEMSTASAPAQWTMNFCLAAIGINFPEHRERALHIGETLGVFRDYPTSKGCTSPFAPIWINEMVSRQ
jgi:3-methyladenine DNA glycosylase AlkD